MTEGREIMILCNASCARAHAHARMHFQRATCPYVHHVRQVSFTNSRFHIFTTDQILWNANGVQLPHGFIVCRLVWNISVIHHHHHHIYSPIITPHKKSHNSLTSHWLAAQVKIINCPQIILSYNKQNTNKKKQQHCAGAIGHEQYHHFNYNSHNTIAR